jgi:hypothetical protein
LPPSRKPDTNVRYHGATRKTYARTEFFSV